MTDRRMYITGGIGSSGFRERFTTDYDLPNSTNYSETCASIGVMMFGQRMAAITGDASYYDYVEKALYNTVIAGINIAGDRYFYVNPLEVVPEFCTEHTYMEHVKPVRQKWFGVACCPPNVGRTLASLGQYIYAEDEYGVYINQFISSTADTEVRESRLKIKMNSTLLQDGKVQIEVQSSGPGNLNIRIPWYSEKCECVQNGISIEIQPEKGYQRLSISPGDTYISLDFHVSPRWMGANNGVRADAGKAALMKGPLVYCLEEKENGRYLSEIFIEENTSIEETAPAEELVGNVPTLSYKGIRVRNKGAAGENQLYGNVELEKEEVDLYKLTREILTRLSPQAAKRKVHVEVTGEPVEYVGIRQILDEMIYNICENAIKYNYDDGWVRVTLNADHKFFYVKIEDSGVGIPEDVQDKIFDRFYRVDKARSRDTGGTGLGLSLTRSTVLLHRGSIKLHSKEKEGSTFTVRIPLTYVV